MLNCYNRGCGQSYDPDQNAEDACRHHPGVPFFHDAYKGWTCCNKKSTDFTEFLNIKGCTVSKHSNVKPPEPEKPKKLEEDKEEIQVTQAPPAELRKPITESVIVRPPFDSALTNIVPDVVPALREAIDSLNLSSITSKTQSEDLNNVPIGTQCKNVGCQFTYSSYETSLSTCKFHSGVPIFHEGMKYYSCCNRKTSDFTSFLNQEGCTSGQHKWFKDEKDNIINCRYDFHQTANDVTVAVYAKMYHYKMSFVKVNPIRLCVHLVFPADNNSKFDIDIELKGMIKPELTKVKFFGTKIEIIMQKAEPVGWSKLEMPRQTIAPAPKEVITKVDEDSSDSSDLDDVDLVKPGARITE